MNGFTRKSSSRHATWYRVLLALSLGGAAACAPAVNIGDLPASSSGATSGGGGSSAGDPPLSGEACGVVTTLASVGTYPGALALAGDSLYLIAYDPVPQGPETGNGTGHIVKVPLAGGAPIELASDQLNPSSIAADATSVYWTTRNAVKSMPVGGGPITVIAAGQNYASGIALDATSVYWGNAKSVMKAPLGGGAATTLFAPGATGVIAVEGVIVDADNVYWSAEVDDGSPSAVGAVMKAPIGGGAPTTLATGLFGMGPVAVDAENVYWTVIATPLADGTQDPGKVQKRRIDGSSGIVTIATQRLPRVVAVDGTAVYWGGGVQDPVTETTSYPTAVSVDSSDGAGPKSILSSVIVGAGLIVCPGGACWTDAATHKVMRFVACAP
jgi:hypothetical protein